MKKIIFILLVLAGLPTQSYSSSCDIENVVLIDKEECSFLGKVIGTEYQCLQYTPDGDFLYNISNPNKKVFVPITDRNYTIMTKKEFEKLNVTTDIDK